MTAPQKVSLVKSVRDEYSLASALAAAGLTAFALSTTGDLTAEQRAAFHACVAREMRGRGGALRITKDAGMFEAW